MKTNILFNFDFIFHLYHFVYILIVNRDIENGISNVQWKNKTKLNLLEEKFELLPFAEVDTTVDISDPVAS